jgi:hypothetical protein
MITEWPEMAVAKRADGFDHGALVHEGPVDDGLGREGLEPEVDELESLRGLLDLDDLDRAGSDVETYAVLGHR